MSAVELTISDALLPSTIWALVSPAPLAAPPSVRLLAVTVTPGATTKPPPFTENWYVFGLGWVTVPPYTLNTPPIVVLLLRATLPVPAFVNVPDTLIDPPGWLSDTVPAPLLARLVNDWLAAGKATPPVPVASRLRLCPAKATVGKVTVPDPDTVTFVSPARVTAPVPMFSAWVPPTPKAAPRLIGLFVDTVTGAAAV